MDRIYVHWGTITVLLVSIAACVLGEAAVDVAYPGGSVSVKKDPQEAAVAPVAPQSSLGASGSSSPTAPLVPPTHLTRAERKRLRKEMRQRSSGNVDVSYPFGSVVVRRGNDSGRNVNVVYPGGSVNVGGNGEAANGGKPAVDVQYPGGSVRLQPKQPGERRKGVIEFPFGRVVLS